MAYRLIETYSDQTVEVEGRSLPAQALVEDDDGLRLLLTTTFTVPVRIWTAAHAGGAVMLAMPWTPGFIYLPVERFEAERTERGDTLEAPNQGRWSWIDHPPRCAEVAPHIDRVVAHAPDPALLVPGKGFVHLHAHSEYSPLDGLSKVEEMVERAVADGQPALGLTDHGGCAGHPDLQKQCKKAGIKPIFGIEAYLVDDRFIRPPSKPKQDDHDYWDELPGERVWNQTTHAFEQQPGERKFNQPRFDAALVEWEQASKRIRDYYHLVLWATNDAGLRNLWAMSTEAAREGRYYVPRMDWDTLERLSEGVMASTACQRGPLGHPLLRYQDTDRSLANLGRLLSIFNNDRLFVELHTNDLPDQIALNKELVSMAGAAGLPTIAVCDSHYACYEDHRAHKVWIASQTNKDLQDEEALFEGDAAYHLMAEREVRQYLSYLPEAVVTESIANTVAVAERCTATVSGSPEPPIFTRPTAVLNRRSNGAPAEITAEEMRRLRVQQDVERLVDRCLANWHKTEGKTVKVGSRVLTEDEAQVVYMERFEMEMGMLVRKGFTGYFDLVWDYVGAAKEGKVRPDGKPILVGPGRGSGGGCLVAYLAGITEIDPVEADLLFARFLTEGRTELPDFDVDFPASQRGVLTDWVVNRWSEEHVVRVGTHIRLRNKGTVRDLSRTLKTTIEIDYKDTDAVCKIIDEAEASSAGLGVKWEDLWTEHSEALDPYRKKYPLLYEMADKVVGRLKSYGKHAAGVVISPDEPLTGRLPLRLVGDDKKDQELVAEFDMDALADLGLVKFDLLTLRNLDTIQMAMDLVEERYGTRINVYDWKQEYRDPQVWDEISDGHTLGIFQIETRSGTRLTKQFRPQSLADLADVITLVRPGPVRSGLTDTYFRRRSGEEAVSFPDPRLEQALGKTYGCIVYQEDIMAVCMILAGYDEVHADKVRKILGKKKVEDVAAEGELFIPACVERGMDRGATEALWNQMAEFAKYSFNRAHAFAYAVIGYWTAWFKFHYPVQFLVAALSTVDKDRIPEFINEARRMGYSVLPPDVNESGVGFKGGEGLVVRYGLDSVKGIGEKATEGILVGQPYASFEDFMERRGKGADLGVVNTLVQVGAFDSLVPNRRSLEAHLDYLVSGAGERCTFKDDSVLGPNGLPCTFDWTSEPVVLGKSGKPLKAKPIPKRCTKACRHYTPPPPVTAYPDLEPYTDADIRDREMEMLGVHLSSTPFDRIPADVLDDLKSASEVDLGGDGPYEIAAVVTKLRTTRDRNGKEMAFATFFAQDGDLEVTIFKDEWAKYKGVLVPQTLCFAMIRKNHRGQTLAVYQPL